MSIESQLLAIASKRLKDAEEIVQTSLVNLGNSIIISAPVDTGALRNSFFSAIGQPNISATREADVSGGGAIANLKQKALEVNLGDDFYMTNSMPYAARIEFNAHSEQAPDGMVRINALRWDSIVETEIQRRK